ncbi:MAG: cytochrome P450 [Myxococcota bacterium]
MNAPLEAAPLAPRPPGPRGLPIVGVAPQMAPSRSLRAVAGWQREYGDVFRLPVFGREMVMVCHPDHFQHVLVTHRDNYVKGSAYDAVRELAGDNLVTLEGEAHKTRRRIAQPAFHTRSLRRLAEIMVTATRRWFDRLQARIPEGGTIDVHREMTAITMEIVVECLFGTGLSKCTQVTYDQMSQALELLSNNANGVSLPRWVPTPGNVKFQRVLKALDTDVHALIDAGREAVARGEDDGSLLQMLLRATDADTGEALDDEALRDEAVTLFLAGHETTALTMTWFMDLVTGPDGPERLMAPLRQEVAEAVGDRPPGFGELVGFAAIRRAIDETLRLRPPAPWVGRQVVATVVVGGYRLEPGDLVMPNFWLLHRHPDFWGDDAERFDPDRFLPEAVEQRHRFAFLPFSTGPRICIGNTFSYVESAAIVAEFARRCTWRHTAGHPEPRPIATLRPSEPVGSGSTGAEAALQRAEGELGEPAEGGREDPRADDAARAG